VQRVVSGGVVCFLLSILFSALKIGAALYAVILARVSESPRGVESQRWLRPSHS
jgi:hypothetical protein